MGIRAKISGSTRSTKKQTAVLLELGLKLHIRVRVLVDYQRIEL